MSRDQAESFCAIQSKLDALLRNLIPGKKQNQIELKSNLEQELILWNRNAKKHESTQLSRIENIRESGMTKTAMKGRASHSMRIPGDSSAHTSITLDAITWASTWEMMNRALDAFASRTTDSSKSRKTFKKPKKFTDDSDAGVKTWVEVMRLQLEQDNLNYERQACTAILSNLEGRALKCVVAKNEEERDAAQKIFGILLNRFGSGMKGRQAMMRF